MKGPRLPRFLLQRLLFLMATNLALLLAIALLLKEGASFGEVLRRSSHNTAPIILAGIGLTAIIYTGAIDLSIASIIVVGGTVLGILVTRHAPPLVSFLACMATVWMLSMLNGFVVRTLKIPALIVTLAGLALYRGLALVLAEIAIPHFSGNISVHEEAYHLPGKVTAGWILLAAVVVALLAEFFHELPRRWLALGSSEEATRLAGMRPAAILQSAFCFSGLFLALAALVFVTRVQAIEPARMALGFELQVIGAVVLGGTNIFGGEGSFLGAILGAFFLYFVSELLIYAGVSPYFQDVVAGALIIAVIGMDCALHRQRKLMEELT